MPKIPFSEEPIRTSTPGAQPVVGGDAYAQAAASETLPMQSLLGGVSNLTGNLSRELKQEFDRKKREEEQADTVHAMGELDGRLHLALEELRHESWEGLEPSEVQSRIDGRLAEEIDWFSGWQRESNDLGIANVRHRTTSKTLGLAAARQLQAAKSRAFVTYLNRNERATSDRINMARQRVIESGSEEGRQALEALYRQMRERGEDSGVVEEMRKDDVAQWQKVVYNRQMTSAGMTQDPKAYDNIVAELKTGSTFKEMEPVTREKMIAETTRTKSALEGFLKKQDKVVKERLEKKFEEQEKKVRATVDEQARFKRLQGTLDDQWILNNSIDAEQAFRLRGDLLEWNTKKEPKKSDLDKSEAKHRIEMERRLADQLSGEPTDNLDRIEKLRSSGEVSDKFVADWTGKFLKERNELDKTVRKALKDELDPLLKEKFYSYSYVGRDEFFAPQDLEPGEKPASDAPGIHWDDEFKVTPFSPYEAALLYNAVDDWIEKNPGATVPEGREFIKELLFPVKLKYARMEFAERARVFSGDKALEGRRQSLRERAQ